VSRCDDSGGATSSACKAVFVVDDGPRPEALGQAGRLDGEFVIGHDTSTI
jgi:hypothetical protein